VPKVITVARGNEPDDLQCLLRFLSTTSIPARASLVDSGAGSPAIRATALSLGISNRIDFLDFRTDIARLLSQSNIFVQPGGDNSAFHNIVEAMRAGLPVIALNVGGASDAVTDGLTGFLVEPGDQAAFCSRLEALLHDTALRRRMGNEGRKRYETEFSLKLMLDRTLEVYRKAVFGAEPRSKSASQPHGRTWSAERFLRRGDRLS
jgi:glycosyltransferase involved in cell wall biosynthesis